MATTTFPDGELPEVIDVVRIAANLFAAGQETTVRLLGSALQIIGERPDLQQLLRERRELIPNFVEETLRIESPVKGDFRLARRDATVGGVDVPGRRDGDGAQRGGQPRSPPLRCTRTSSASTARTRATTSPSASACTAVPARRSRACEARVSIERILDRMADIRISEEHHGPADARRYQYVPTYILRGLTQLHLEFTPAGG